MAGRRSRRSEADPPADASPSDVPAPRGARRELCSEAVRPVQRARAPACWREEVAPGQEIARCDFGRATVAWAKLVAARVSGERPATAAQPEAMPWSAALWTLPRQPRTRLATRRPGAVQWEPLAWREAAAVLRRVRPLSEWGTPSPRPTRVHPRRNRCVSTSLAAFPLTPADACASPHIAGRTCKGRCGVGLMCSRALPRPACVPNSGRPLTSFTMEFVAKGRCGQRSCNG